MAWLKSNKRLSPQQKLEENEMLQAAYRFALSLTHNTHDAEDLVQLAWLKLTRKYGKVDSKAIFYRTIRNAFYDQYRRSKIVRFETLDLPKNDEFEAPRARPEAVAKKAMTAGVKDDLNLILSRLNDKERELLYLNCVEGYSAREISEFTGSPRGSILSVLSRAKKKLQTFVTEEEARVHAHTK